jgi:hypothetical protein
MSLSLRRTIALLVPVLLAAALLAATRHHATAPSRFGGLERCLQGRAEREDAAETACPGAPESSEDLARINAEVGVRIGPDTRGGLSRAMAQRDAIARQSAAEGVPGSGGTWAPYGKGPLLVDDPSYQSAFGDGFGHVNGRINDFTYVAQTKRLYAAVAQGGLWESADLGRTWRSIGDNLPIGSTGSVGWSPADGGTLIVATGDMAYSNDYAGVGVYWSTDDGVTWVKAKGAPDGALSFRVAVDPTNPDVVYAATGMGLYRSTDAGHSFTNVNLPTSPQCAGNSLAKNCFFANMVTDVVVQPKDKFGHAGGKVLAAVGWRAGQRPNFNNVPDAPNNGLYASDTGAPGTFSKVPESAGFTPTDRAGRVALGVSDGPGQNSNYLYAVSQDAKLFQQTVEGNEDDTPFGTPSVLDAIYVSPDFGRTWTVMEDRQSFFNPANGSSLSPLVPLDIGPGYQVTYNEWIKPDPTKTDAATGAPTRVLLGMEEVWQTDQEQPQTGSSSFHVVGQYTANGGACLVRPDLCGAKQNTTPTNTTTHPDQHGVAMVPDGKGGVTLVAGNDGGAYGQHVDTGQDFSQSNWGDGSNEGFYTLLPYGVAVAKDGTAYAGLQDNGQLKISPDGKQNMTYVGDGTFALVDPNNSKVNYDELPLAGINVSTDGGATYRSIDPDLTSPDFVAPMVMDPNDANHLMAVGREVKETTLGPDTTATCSGPTPIRFECEPPPDQSKTWKTSYDLGTKLHPGDANATSSADDPNNHGTAATVVGDDAYVGFCGSCDPVKLKQRFHNGFATNVGGAKPGKRTTSDGWHIAGARGLPSRIITSVAMDPRDHRTVYVTLGASAARFFAPIGSQGEDTSDVGSGHVYKSTDAGETFKDISGDLPDAQATWTVVHDGQLVVATAVGIFVSRGTDGGDYALLGEGLPPVATYSMTLKPGDPDTLVAATYGRGIYKYRFAPPHAVLSQPRPGPGCIDKVAPTSRFAKTARIAKASRRLRLKGTSKDLGCGKGRRGTVKRIRVSIARRTGKKCRSLLADGKLSRKRTSCRRTSYVNAKGSTRWTLTLKRRLPRGRYQIWVRGVDAAGNVEHKSRKRNFKRLRVR